MTSFLITLFLFINTGKAAINTEVLSFGGIQNLPVVHSFQPKPSFRIGLLDYNQLPRYLKNQIEGAGCEYTFTKDGNAFMINGLMKINGVYEMLERTKEYDKTIIYENDRWQLKLYLQSTSHFEGGSSHRGTMWLKNKRTNQIKTSRMFGGCGC